MLKNGEEKIVVELDNKHVKIEKIYSNNASTHWLIQDEIEIVYLVKGSAELEYEDRIVRLNKGDYIYIDKYIKHRVRSTSKDCEWFCVFVK